MNLSIEKEGLLINGKLDINLSLKKQFNLLRIGNNDQWPSYFILNGNKYILKIYKKEKNSIT